MSEQSSPAEGADERADVVGVWVTADGHIRQELRADGRYDEARGTRRSAYSGRYTLTGSHLDYVDDTGFTATGDIRDGVLHHEHSFSTRRNKHDADHQGRGHYRREQRHR
ncbi:Atu4866 domain-containing protein [Streptomyces sp. NPDC005283]|uniref:Atu4866 domain-containing protein n=1 Tax=Streptomyces sp. NPDC005283 TaxID=3156871 RepID=UPI003454965D